MEWSNPGLDMDSGTTNGRALWHTRMLCSVCLVRVESEHRMRSGSHPLAASCSATCACCTGGVGRDHSETVVFDVMMPCLAQCRCASRPHCWATRKLGKHHTDGKPTAQELEHTAIAALYHLLWPHTIAALEQQAKRCMVDAVTDLLRIRPTGLRDGPVMVPALARLLAVRVPHHHQLPARGAPGYCRTDRRAQHIDVRASSPAALRHTCNHAVGAVTVQQLSMQRRVEKLT